MDFVAHLEKPFDTVIAVDDRQNVFFCGRAHEAVLDHRGETRVPRDLTAGQECKQIKRMHLIFKAGLGMQLRHVLGYICESAVHRGAACIGTQVEIAL